MKMVEVQPGVAPRIGQSINVIKAGCGAPRIKLRVSSEYEISVQFGGKRFFYQIKFTTFTGEH